MKKPRVLVIVNGGVAEFVADEGVDVEVFDWDDYEVDPYNTPIPPPHFKDICEEYGIPFVEMVQ